MKIHSRILCILLFLLFFVTAGAVNARAQSSPDAEIVPGDTFKGRISFPTDEDSLLFEAIAGTQFGCVAKAVAPLAPSIQIIDLTSEASLGLTGFVKGAGTKTVTVSKLTLPSTGSYLILIGSGNGETGNYTFTTSAKAPKTATSIKSEKLVTPGNAVDFAFAAFAGGTVTIVLDPGKNSPAIPDLESLVTPAGISDISAFTTIKGKKTTAKNIPINNFGTHSFRVDNSGTTGNIKSTITIKPPKVKKLTFVEPEEPTTPGSIAGSIDSHVADAFPESEPNDNIQNDQFIGQLSPGKVLRVAGSTNSGTGDVDLYRVVVSESQTITVTLLHSVANDFDFCIVDTQTGQCFNGLSFATTNEPEVGIINLTFTGSGQAAFDIAVAPFSGSGGYLLTIVSGPLAAIAKVPPTPGSPITMTAIPPIKKNPNATKTAASRPMWTESLENRVLELDREFVSGEMVVQLRDPAAKPAEFAAREGLNLRLASPGGAFLLEVPGVARGIAAPRADRIATIRRKQQIRMLPEVSFAEPNYIYHPASVRSNGGGKAVMANTPNDPFFNLQWHYPLIHLPEAWAVTKGSSNVIVAIIDTGVTAHPDLAGRDSGTGMDMISDPQIANDGDGIDTNPTDPGDLSDQGKSSWHGTHVAGTIGAATDNGIGVSGVDWFCKLMHVRALGVGGGTNFDIGEAMKYTAKIANASGLLPAARANVINMSLGGPGFSQNQQNICNAVKAAGVVIVAAAGNENSSTPSFPASYAGVISVAAVDFASQRAPYSNFGENIDIAAPGGDLGADQNQDNFADGVLSTLVDDSSQPFKFIFKFYQGTSMASPHVAGVASLLLAANPALTPDQVEQALESTATDLGTAGKDSIFGHGLVNAFAAVQSVITPNPNGNPQMSTSLTELSFGSTSTNLNFNIVNVGGGTVNFTIADSENVGGNWLSVNKSAGTAPDSITATVSRNGLAPGAYTGTIQVNSNGGNTTIQVAMEVPATSALPVNLGSIIVIAVDAVTLDSVAQATVDLNGDYIINNLAPGEYLLVAGPDLDGDNSICGTGEPCGIFPSLESPASIKLPGGTSILGADFLVVDQLVLPSWKSSVKFTIPPQGISIPLLK